MKYLPTQRISQVFPYRCSCGEKEHPIYKHNYYIPCHGKFIGINGDAELSRLYNLGIEYVVVRERKRMKN